jgi:hypothetical protein
MLFDKNISDLNATYDITNESEFKDLITTLKTIMMFLILVIGVVGNVLNVIVFAKKHMRQESTFRFLLYLSIFDILVLIFGTKDILIKQIYEFEIRIYSNFICKIDTFLTYTLTHVNSFILIAVSVHRAIKMKNIIPFTKKTNNTRNPHIRNDYNANDNNNIETLSLNQFEILADKFDKNENSEINTFVHESRVEKVGSLKYLSNKVSVDFIVFFIICFMTFLNFHFILFINLNDVAVLHQIDVFGLSPEEASILAEYITESALVKAKKCYAQSDTFYEVFLKKAWFWIDMSVYSIAPFFFMSMASTFIAMKFKKINRKYSYLLMNKNYQLNRVNYIKKMKKNRQICLMLLNANFYFLFIMAFYWISFLIFKISNDRSEFFKELQTFAYIFLYTNNAFQFLIYGASSSRYRRELHLTFFNNIT